MPVAGVSLTWKVAGIGDFDGDGRADILWRNTSTGADAIWLGANPSRPMAVASVANLDWKIAGIGDFDGDGRSDVAQQPFGRQCHLAVGLGHAGHPRGRRGFAFLASRRRGRLRRRWARGCLLAQRDEWRQRDLAVRRRAPGPAGASLPDTDWQAMPRDAQGLGGA